jgi:pSer/pThr/pTyr-binding forkhead associated (FHA) protein
MPRFILKFDDRTLTEYPIGSELTIGRLPDNMVIIDNPAVSGHHARVFLEGNQFVLEDLQSKNGTYVNEKHAVRATLKSGDVVLIGKHKLVFDETEAVKPVGPRPVQPSVDKTAYLDTKSHRARLARLREERARADEQAKMSDALQNGIAVLRVLDGRTDRREYELEGNTSFIGKSEISLVRLRGWFRPKEAAAIVRKETRYVLTVLKGRTFVNSRRLNGSHELTDGDILEIGGLIMKFCLSGASYDESRHSPEGARELAS